ncbi:MAG: CYTH and CHAD domain-containing protein [Comamonadaceae bacterium]|nr:MAG: CYTH and CHAD domain-containing protein [Comamonadaceae bacterium]
MEIEFKFIVPAERLEAVEEAVKEGGFSVTRLQAHYFDTPGKALSALGIAFRVRKEGAAWIQTVKAPGRGPLAREEHNVELRDFAGGGQVPDPTLHQGSVAGDLLLKALSAARDDLVETYETAIERVTRDLSFDGGGGGGGGVGGGGCVVELALDTGKVLAHRGQPEEKQARVCELEMELKQGEVAGLVALASQWVHAHGLSLSTVSKAQRGERLLSARWARPAEKAQPMAAARRHLPGGRALQRLVVANCLQQMIGNASEMVEGSGDDEHVHQLRIGIRRLRTALRDLNALAPGALHADWEAPLKEVFRRLGELRDRAQVLQSVDTALRDAGGPQVGRLKGPEQSAEQIVCGSAFQSTLVQLLGFTAAPDQAAGSVEDASLGPKASQRALAKKLESLLKQVRKDVESFRQLAPAKQHRLRKRLKRLRYLAEFLAPALRQNGKPFLQRLKPAQAALGRLNDEQVAEDLYRAIASEDPKAWFGVGWLAARREALVVDAQRALKRMGDRPQLRKKAIR